MTTGDESVGGQVLVKEGKHLGGTRSIAPVAHEIRSDSELRENVDPSITHAVVGLVGGLDVEGAAGVRVDEDGVASFTEGEGDEDDADVCGDARDDDLLLPRCLHGVAEVLVIPSIDLAVPLDEGGIGMHLDDLLGQRTVGTSLGAGGQDSGQIEDLADSSVSEHIVPVLVGLPVARQVEQPNLVVHDEEGGVVLVDALERERDGEGLDEEKHHECGEGGFPGSEGSLRRHGCRGMMMTRFSASPFSFYT